MGFFRSNESTCRNSLEVFVECKCQIHIDRTMKVFCFRGWPALKEVILTWKMKIMLIACTINNWEINAFGLQ